MSTVLQYLVIAAAIGLVVFAIAVLVFGRGEQLAPLSPRTSPTELPDVEVTGEDVRRLRFAVALRGYRMSDVDWTLDRMADELDRLRAKLAATSAELTGEVESGTAGTDSGAVDVDSGAVDVASGPDEERPEAADQAEQSDVLANER